MSKVYVFTHAWLSPLQKGIQAAHAVAELVAIGTPDTKDWVKYDKTLILLDGGNSDTMKVTNFEAAAERVGYYEKEPDRWTRKPPFNNACFYEDDSSMEGMLTAVAVLMPDKYVAHIAESREGQHWGAFKHIPIINRILNAKLAS
jgi:hypothetical protein